MQYVFLKELYINQLVLKNLRYFKNENKYFEVLVFEKRRKLKKKICSIFQFGTQRTPFFVFVLFINLFN